MGTSQQKVITVVSIDDHPLVRQGISHILSQASDIKLVGEGWAGEHVFSLVDQYRPHVLLLDIGLPAHAEHKKNISTDRFPIIPALHRLARQYPQTHTIIVSQYDTGSLIRAAIDAGVKGYLVKDDVLTTELCDAVRTVDNGGYYYSKIVQDRVLAMGERQNPTLASRQLEILSVFAARPDIPRVRIAEELSISEHTLNRYLNKIYEDLGVTNLAAALIKSMQLNLLPYPQSDDPAYPPTKSQAKR